MTAKVRDRKGKALTPEQNAAVVRSMWRAGVPQKYHNRELKEFGVVGEAMRQRILEPGFSRFVSSGGGFSFSGSDPLASYDLAIVAARAMRIIHLDIRVINLVSLAQYLSQGYQSDDTRFDEIEAAKGLVLTRFYEPVDELPFSRSEFYRMENFLSAKMEDGFSVSVQHAGNLDHNQKWWSPFFVRRIQSANEEINISSKGKFDK